MADTTIRGPQFRQPSLSWRIHASVAAFLILLAVVIPAILVRSVGLDSYGRYLVLVLIPALLPGVLVVETVLPRLINTFALRRAGSDVSPATLRTVAILAWRMDALCRGLIAACVIALLVFVDPPVALQRISITVVAVMLFLGLLNLIVGPQTAHEIEAGGPHAARQAALTALQGAASRGVRPRDWDPVAIEQALTPMDETIWGVQALLLAYYHELDSGRSGVAENLISRATEIAQPTHAPWISDVWHEAAFTAAHNQNDPEVARGCLRFLRKSRGTMQAHSLNRIEAAILLVEDNPEAARRVARRGIAGLAESANSAIAQLDADLLREVLNKADERSTSTPPSVAEG